MTDHDDTFAPGEIKRALERIERQIDGLQKDTSARYHDLANKMNAALGPVSELRFRAEQQGKDLDEVADKVRNLEKDVEDKVRGLEKGQNAMNIQAAWVAGAVAGIVTVAGLVLKFLLMPVK